MQPTVEPGVCPTVPDLRPVLGPEWQLRVLDSSGADLDLVHDWMRRPHIASTWDQAWERDVWARELADQLAGQRSRPCLVSMDGEPVAYLEIYRAEADRLAAYYPARQDDHGVHIAIGAPERTGRGTGRALLRAVADGLLAALPGCTRVVAEPNVTNEASVRAFTAAGFHRVGDIRLPHKVSALMVRPRGADDLPSLPPAPDPA